MAWCAVGATHTKTQDEKRAIPDGSLDDRTIELRSVGLAAHFGWTGPSGTTAHFDSKFYSRVRIEE